MKNLDTLAPLTDEVVRLEKELDAARLKRARALKKAKDERWTYQAIADAAKMTKEAVRNAIVSLEPGVKEKLAAARREMRARK